MLTGSHIYTFHFNVLSFSSDLGTVEALTQTKKSVTSFELKTVIGNLSLKYVCIKGCVYRLLIAFKSEEERSIWILSVVFV